MADEHHQNERMARIEHEAKLLTDYSGWEVCEHPEKKRMAYNLVSNGVPWLLARLREVQEENERLNALVYRYENAVEEPEE